MVVTNPKVFFAFYRIPIGHPNKIFMRTSRYLFTFYSTPLLLKHDCKNTPGHLFENLTLREVSKSAILIGVEILFALTCCPQLDQSVSVLF